MAELKFEKALKRLEQIVEEMEQGELDLDKSLARFEEGIKLTKICSKHLNQAEQRIEIVMKERGGDVQLAPFEPVNKEERENDDY